MSMQEVLCQECGRKIEVHPAFVEDGLVAGQYVKAQKMVKFKNWQGDVVDQFIDGIFDICKSCQRKAVVRSGDPTYLQHRRILRRFYQIREARSDLTNEQCSAEAVREEFDPVNEPNRAFRAFLMDRATRDPENDAAAHRALESIT